MNVQDLLGSGPTGVGINALAFDHRRVVPGTLFFCVPGLTRDGHDFAPEAISKGASALVVERSLNLGIPEVIVNDVRAAMAQAAARFYGDPSASLQVVGITGTNGKTTTAFLLRNLLENAGQQCGLLGTVKAVVGGVERQVTHTTSEAIDLQHSFREMLDGGDRACAMEVSSHALALKRADGTKFAAAVFTNLTQDHLDFHTDFEDYFQAKRKLFAMDAKSRIANVDDPYGRRLAEEFPNTVTFATSASADYVASGIRSDRKGTSFVLKTPDESPRKLSIPLPGNFNVLNVLGAWVAARSLGIESALLASAVEQLKPVPGRFQSISEGQDFSVFVDYAHTPDSLESILRTARELTDSRVLVVFGAGGDRDREKRPLMGAVAAGLADVCIVTSDNPRTEDPQAIIADIVAGATSDVEAEVDRRTAIQAALTQARSGDIVLIAGKGHERGQEFAAGHTERFDDVSVVRETLRGVTAAEALR